MQADISYDNIRDIKMTVYLIYFSSTVAGR
jgi:hypothetical protein